MELNLYSIANKEERELVDQWFDILTNELSSLPPKENAEESEDVNKLNWEALLFFRHLL
ncbi:hypothetical protein HUW51_10540 [Adhaeribacter swui]|uniref:PH domain-containing protein n=1 Tax=Adhaeribacter swui TaxID=2086471 RepID=A0A7G7G7K8_9BACT|nr:hypothetical protein [Adhaeribacter swui]QNF33142.1 hypothetical protein HUW51_10540 [Adhaeribacter swui]